MNIIKKLPIISAAISLSLASFGAAQAAPSERAQKVFDHWTAERVANAKPRDLVIDHRGLGYLKGVDGSLTPYGHSVRPALRQLPTNGKPVPKAKPPSGGNDTTPPSFGARSPANGAEIGGTQTFSAVVTDASGIKSVTFVVTENGQTQNFSGSFAGNDTWETTLSGFTSGSSGSWRVTAKDNARRGGNTATSSSFGFTVGDGGNNGGNDTVANAHWDFGGAVQTAAGRLLYEMPDKGKRWAAFVCSGTAATDGVTGRSIIITAAHCVYDDSKNKFARNVLFIPNQDQTSGSGTDYDCSNDPLGCWAPEIGVVEENWTASTFPNNIPWDYAYYVVSDSGSHSGNGSGGALDSAVGTLGIDFLPPYVDDGDPGANSLDFTHALGYSYSDDPNFMYCAEDMTTEGADNWWLPSCDLSGGSSGGPWVQPMNEGNGSGPIISVNSWGYNGSSGMAGPFLSGTTASCVFDAAKTADLNLGNNPDGEQGFVVNPATCPLNAKLSA